MTRKTLFVVHPALLRGIDPDTELAPAAASVGAQVLLLDQAQLRDQLAELECRAAANEIKPILFCTLQAANIVRRQHPHMAAGLALPRELLDHSTYTAHIDVELQLNPEGIYLPWGRIPSRVQMLERIMGPRLFLRPNSPMKVFPGFDVDASGLAEEHRLRTATDRVDPGELTFIAPARKIEAREFRMWVVESRIATSASYSWLDLPPAPVPAEALEAGADVVRAMEMLEGYYTMDFAMTDAGPKLVELNALSTSGWYPGLDLKALFEACDASFF